MGCSTFSTADLLYQAMPHRRLWMGLRVFYGGRVGSRFRRRWQRKVIRCWSRDQKPQAYEKYRGTFAGHPAELRFFYEKNHFCNGMATFLDSFNKASSAEFRAHINYNDVRAYNAEMRKVYLAKYGPGVDSTLSDRQNFWYEDSIRWENITTTVISGTVTIDITCNRDEDVFVIYDIRSAWADGGSI